MHSIGNWLSVLTRSEHALALRNLKYAIYANNKFKSAYFETETITNYIEMAITKVAPTDVELDAESYSNATGFPLGVPISTSIHFAISTRKAL